MNLPELHRKLIAAARAESPDDRVPYAFEKRIMARLAGHKPVDAMTLWGRALSRAAACCVAFMLMLSCVSYFLPASASQPSISQDLDQTLFAAADNGSTDQDSQ